MLARRRVGHERCGDGKEENDKPAQTHVFDGSAALLGKAEIRADESETAISTRPLPVRSVFGGGAPSRRMRPWGPQGLSDSRKP